MILLFSGRVIGDGEELPFCGGITVIHLPGHTPGHIGLYHHSSKTLIAGDALFVDNSRLTVPPDSLNVDTDLAINSLKKLTQYDIAQIICCHGGLYTKNPNQSLIEFTNNSEN